MLDMPDYVVKHNKITTICFHEQLVVILHCLNKDMPLLDEKFQDPTAQLSGFFYLKYMNKQKVIVYVDGFNFYYGLKSFVTSHRDTKYSYISPH